MESLKGHESHPEEAAIASHEAPPPEKRGGCCRLCCWCLSRCPVVPALQRGGQQQRSQIAAPPSCRREGLRGNLWSDAWGEIRAPRSPPSAPRTNPMRYRVERRAEPRTGREGRGGRRKGFGAPFNQDVGLEAVRGLSRLLSNHPIGGSRSGMY